jgi:glycosyltransferase involved in cell wall biosynthesis
LFVKGNALREAGLIGTDGGASWADLINNYCQRIQSRGLSTRIGDSLQSWGKGNPASDYLKVLAIVHSGKGGARFSVEDILKGLSEFSHCLLLETGPVGWNLHEVAQDSFRIIRNDRFSEPWSLESGPGEERLMALADICSKFSPDIVNIHHLMGSGPEVIDLFSERGIPVVFSLHDQYAICPTAHLVDERGRFCGGNCTDTIGQCALNPDYFRNMSTPLKHDFVHTHRKRMGAALKKCQSYVVPSSTTWERLCEFYDFLKSKRVEIIGHGRDIPTVNVAVRPTPDQAARVVCIGSISLQKGADLVLELARLNQLHGRRFEFHFLGNRPPEFAPEKYGGVYHGSYTRAGLQVMLKKIAPSFSLLAPVCEETFSFTLTESWASGIPVFASDRGALRERISMYGGGWLFDPEDAWLFFRGMVNVLECPCEWDGKVELIQKIPLAGLDQECRRLKTHFDRVLAGDDSP